MLNDDIDAWAAVFRHRLSKVLSAFHAPPDETGQNSEDSDLDVLVEPLPETTLFDLGGLQEALEEALGVRVDVKTPRDLPAHIRNDVLRQAVAV